MFEKEAKEYTKKRSKILGINDLCLAYHAIQRAYKNGAEFGYNKANKWHYPSKGEYPKERQLVLGIFQPSEYYTPTELVFYEKELDCWSNQMGDSEYHNIYAWKEISLPEQEG